jgi:hypothetical protein
MLTFKEFLAEISWGGLAGAAAGLRLGNGDTNRSQTGRVGLEGMAGAVAGYYAGKALEKKFSNPPVNVKPEPQVQQAPDFRAARRARINANINANVKSEPSVQQAPKLASKFSFFDQDKMKAKMAAARAPRP